MSDNNPTGEGSQGTPAAGDASAQPVQPPVAPETPTVPAAPAAPQFQAPAVPEAPAAPQFQAPAAPAAPAAPQFQVPAAPQAPGAPQFQAPAAPQAPGVPQYQTPAAPAAPAAPQMQAPGAIGMPGAPGGPGAPQAPGAPQYRYPGGPQQSKGLAISALVLGLIALIGGIIFAWIPFVGGVITVLLGAAALVLGFIALSKKQSKGLSLTGLITGGLAVLLGIGGIIGWSIAFASINEYSNSFDEYQSEIDSYDFDDEYDYDYGTSDDNSSSYDTEYSEAFCNALFSFEDSRSPETPSNDPDFRLSLERIAAVDSPNQDVYQTFLDVTDMDAGASESEVITASTDLMNALVDDGMACNASY